MQENDESRPQADITRILNTQDFTFRSYHRLLDELDSTQWSASLTPDEKVMRHALAYLISNGSYKTYRMQDGCNGSEEPAATVERLSYIVGLSIGMGIIIARGLRNSGDHQDEE
ncbi:MAG: hypothetical protein KA401_04195 [Anaerolineae bacterium]|nr:hypothetical protein [Anaerolineae bacterium]